MKAGYRRNLTLSDKYTGLYVSILLAALLAVSLCEESVEVSVDNEPTIVCYVSIV